MEGRRNLMDDQLLSMFSHALFDLESFSDSIDELLIPRQPVAGENAGKAVTSKGSKMPLSTSMLDMKISVEQLLARWCAQLSRDSECGQPPASCRIEVRAAWLQRNLFAIDDMPWGEVCAQEMIAETRLIRDVVSPPASRDDPIPIEVGTTREIVGWVRHLGFQVSRATVRRMVDSGEIPSEMVADGRVLIRLSDVVDQLQARQLGNGPPLELC